MKTEKQIAAAADAFAEWWQEEDMNGVQTISKTNQTRKMKKPICKP